ncbi:MAG: hypothetical protein U1E53_15720 [Dongiaceae bacterium]
MQLQLAALLVEGEDGRVAGPRQRRPQQPAQRVAAGQPVLRQLADDADQPDAALGLREAAHRQVAVEGDRVAAVAVAAEGRHLEPPGEAVHQFRELQRTDPRTGRMTESLGGASAFAVNCFCDDSL